MSRATASLTLAWQAQSALLCYPGPELPGRLPLLARAAAELPAAAGGPLAAFIARAGSTEAEELAAEYVATFDHSTRHSLYLTYYAHGETRNRGAALLALKNRYATAGLALDDTELPDHLAVALEFAAIAGVAAGRELLGEFGAEIRLLHDGLRADGSAWAQVTESVLATLTAARTRPLVTGGSR